VILSGVVSAQRQPLVRLVVRGPRGQEQTIEALLDSGFNGTLALPEAVISAMGWEYRRAKKIMIADGSAVDVAEYRGRILWEGIERPVAVIATGLQPIVGMALPYGYRITIDMVDGGEVRVTAMDGTD